jgi:tetratricopeptide (TPR) repeat protein
VDDNHPTPRELEGVLLGGVAAERARAVILHLLRGCAECNLALLPYLPQRFLTEGRPEAPLPFPPEAYDAPIDRAFAAALGPRVPSAGLLEESKREALALLLSGSLEALADAPADVEGLPLFEALLERSWALRHDDPPQMVQLARAAALLAGGLSGGELGARKVADLRCRAWTEVANACRVNDDLDSAEGAIGRALEHFCLGTRDEILLARFFTVFGSQQAARRDFHLACAALDLAVIIYRQHGDLHLAGRALIIQGIFAGYAGDPEKAILNFEQGLSMTDEARDPGLVLAALQAQAWFLVDCGHYQKAQRTLWELRRRGFDAGGRLGELKLLWLEGHINTGLKKFSPAETALRQVKEGFEAAGLGYKAALAGLELGAVWLQQGCLQQAEGIVLECADVFLALRIRRELLASILVLRKAAETRYLNLTLLQRVIGLLHREDRNPKVSPREEV